mgnify:CR=1 FL=1|tara:strand:- start:613 stop:963 length:351 start_codon:yes stop_codon:yes gene_type:complete
MPQFNIPIIIVSPNSPNSTLQDTPESIGSVLTNIEVSDFINSCSEEEYSDLVNRIREIENQSPLELPPGLRQLNEEELGKLGLPPSPFVEDMFTTQSESKPISREPVNRANKKNKK